MTCYEANVEIGAPAQDVWASLVDVASWPDWDSGVDKVDGKVELGETLRIRSKAAPGRVFPVRVTAMTAPATLVFTGGMPMRLFTGVRTYTLESAGGVTRFRMREEYGGPLAGLIGRSIPDLTGSFEQFANGLKQRVERDTAAR